VDPERSRHPIIGHRPIADIRPSDILELLSDIEASGRLETAKPVRQTVGAVFRLATLRLALEFQAHTFTRPIEIRFATWDDIDLETSLWTIPAERMKMRRPHDVPLVPATRQILREVRKYTGRSHGLIFHSPQNPNKPMSENTLNKNIWALGYKGRHCSHGFRSSASTLLNESKKYDKDVIEFQLAHLCEALLAYISTGVLPTPAVVAVSDPFQHPDAQRRFRVVEDIEELEQAFNFPWEKWIVFLHPSQRELVEKDFKGPARVMGAAGTGKSVVALHRAVRLARTPTARVLLTTFSDPLASALERKLKILVGESSSVVPRISVGSFFGIAKELYKLAFGRSPAIASAELVKSLLIKAAAAQGNPVSDRFLISEWAHVVDAWQVRSAEAYGSIPRLGRKGRMGSKQSDRVWPVFQTVLQQIAQRGMLTEAGVFQAVADHYRDREEKPFTNIVVDEAQDLGVAELRFLAAIAPPTPNALFSPATLVSGSFSSHSPGNHWV